jgi:hypothetical protein
VSQTGVFGSPWQGSLSDLANIIQHIKRSKAFGRLSLRNPEPISIAHLYYRAGKLIHVVGNRGDARAILLNLKNWRNASVRFERSKFIVEISLNEEHEKLLDDVLAHLYRQGLVTAPQNQPSPIPPSHIQPRSPMQQTQPIRSFIESDFAATSEPKQLITPSEWHLLLESTRRVSLAVAHLVGPYEALRVLQDILDDCSSSFPACVFLAISPNGYLQVVNQSHLDHLLRDELIEGFTALLAICQHFCTPIIGERDAHLLILQTLQELALPLATIGVFRIDNHLLADGGFSKGDSF